METMWVERLRRNKDTAEMEWVPMEETFDLASDFAMEEDKLSANICQMGQLMVRYASIAGDQQANLRRKEENVKLMRASVAGAVRSQAEANGTKMTESKLDEQVTVHPTYQQALSELHILRADAIKADHWYRSIVKKADLLNSLAFRQNAEMKHL